jgi:parallel beta-helix repeat protein
MSRHLSGLQTKRIGVIGIAVVLIAAIWLVFFGSPGELEVIGCVGETSTFVCGDTITESCRFNGNTYSSSMVGFTIGADNIIIDGNGYSLIGPGEQSGEEAIHCEGHCNVTIKNLNIDYYFGIFFKDVADSEITGCTVSYDYGSAIWLWSSCRNRLIGNNVGPGTGGHGILLWDSSENTLEDNNVQTGYGVGMAIEENSNDNSLYGNQVCGNARGDIVVDAGSSHNTGSDNIFDTLIGDFGDESRSPCPE